MKYLIILFLIAPILTLAESFDYEKVLGLYDYMNSSDAKKKWPKRRGLSCQIKSDLFLKLPVADQSACLVEAASIMTTRGKNREEVLKLYSEGNTYFFSEMNLTYALQQLKESNDTWVVSFFISSDNLIRDIKISKKCCYKIR